MNVVRRNNKIFKTIFHTVIMSQSVLNNFSQFRPYQQTFALAFIQPFLPTVRKTLVIFLFDFWCPRFGIFLQPFFPFGKPFIHPRFGQRIRCAPSNKIRHAILPPVRKIAAA